MAHIQTPEVKHERRYAGESRWRPPVMKTRRSFFTLLLSVYGLMTLFDTACYWFGVYSSLELLMRGLMGIPIALVVSAGYVYGIPFLRYRVYGTTRTGHRCKSSVS